MDRVTLYFKECARLAEETVGDSDDGAGVERGMSRAARIMRIQRRAKESVEAQLGRLKRIRRRTTP